MRAIRVCLSAIIILVIVSIAGCGKKYYFSFKDNQSLTDGEHAWLAYGEGTSEFFWNGVALDDKSIACPFAFRGDVTISITYELDVSDMEQIRFYFLIASGPGYPSDSYHGGAINAGNPLHQDAIVIEKHYSSDNLMGYWPGVVPGLDKDGENVIQIVKRGDHFKFRLNGELLTDYVAQMYFPNWFYVQVMGEIGDSTYEGALVVKEVSITYTGDIQEI